MDDTAPFPLPAYPWRPIAPSDERFAATEMWFGGPRMSEADYELLMFGETFYEVGSDGIPRHVSRQEAQRWLGPEVVR